MNKPVEVFTFSGTGNCDAATGIFVARLRAAGTVAHLRAWRELASFEASPEKIVGFVLPVNTQFTMPFIWNAIRSLPRAEGQPFFVIVTLNSSSDLSRHILKSLVQKGWGCVGILESSLPNNVSEGSFDPIEDGKRIETARREINLLAAALTAGQTLKITKRKGSTFVSFLARATQLPWISQRLLSPLAVDTMRCKRCGLCAKECPPCSCIRMTFDGTD